MDYDALLKLAAYVAHYMPNGWHVDRRFSFLLALRADIILITLS